MGKLLKGIAIFAGIVVVVVVLAAGGLYANGVWRLNRTYSVTPEAVAIPSDPNALVRGEHIARTHCFGCHGDDLAGTVIFDEPALGRVEAPNLTKGQGGVSTAFTDADFVRAIRHGVKPDGKSVAIMPSDAYYYYGDEDLGALIAYVRSVPPVDRNWSAPRFTPLAHVLLSLGAFGKVTMAEFIDHTGPRPPAPAPAVNSAYGEYVVDTSECRTCHGAGLGGGKAPNPNAPPAPDLTRSGAPGGWTEEQFLSTLRTGRTPDGRQLSDFMPWKQFGQMDEIELKALWAYLQSLPAK